jgi:hypothetical protein
MVKFLEDFKAKAQSRKEEVELANPGHAGFLCVFAASRLCVKSDCMVAA